MPSENLSDGIFLPKQPYFLSGLQNFIRSDNNLFIVIPAQAGIQNVKSKETVLPDKFPHRQT
ncbi:hypothetical protein [Neisseria meningitidis]|uniref:hypothetical protein n=1 Tax=Neisseria meningitidis TaxID=487 RepID=UPI0003083E4A|nr:hypothetical protein [Neisseria meningitidis]MBH2048990.1 hypothetical protein [Neisseria meningitidis]MBH2082454.1 hypothetical protein [Neisseria meningitidis]MBH2250067.1 hypothetical protein [Neisseria meningitidis]MBH5611187.1 hypothetical protein [Neisseria meningitidis]MBH5666915.1 hypothetical protein [Neisseria meningitidis]